MSGNKIPSGPGHDGKGTFLGSICLNPEIVLSAKDVLWWPSQSIYGIVSLPGVEVHTSHSLWPSCFPSCCHCVYPNWATSFGVALGKDVGRVELVEEVVDVVVIGVVQLLGSDNSVVVGQTLTRLKTYLQSTSELVQHGWLKVDLVDVERVVS